MKFEFLLFLEARADMPMDQAIGIFKKLGATADDLSSPAKIKIFRMSQLRNGLHPDIGGMGHDAALLNSAYDTLKNGIPTASSKQDYSSSSWDNEYRREPPKAEPTPIWAMAGHSGGAPPSHNIYRQDYTDLNYIKKSMYFMSKDDKNQKIYYVSAFDGHFFRGSFSTYASPEIFHELAQAMITWNSHGGNPYSTRAVFVQKGRPPDMFGTDRWSKELYLIYADGKYYRNPIHFEHDSPNMNAGNDQQFVRRLPEMLDNLKETGSPHKKKEKEYWQYQNSDNKGGYIIKRNGVYEACRYRLKPTIHKSFDNAHDYMTKWGYLPKD